MSEFEAEVKKAEKELEQSLIPVNPDQAEGQNSFLDDEFLGDLKMQAQEYGQKLQDAAAKAKDFAGEKFAQAGDKFKELRAKIRRSLSRMPKNLPVRNRVRRSSSRQRSVWFLGSY